MALSKQVWWEKKPYFMMKPRWKKKVRIDKIVISCTKIWLLFELYDQTEVLEPWLTTNKLVNIRPNDDEINICAQWKWLVSTS